MRGEIFFPHVVFGIIGFYSYLCGQIITETIMTMRKWMLTWMAATALTATAQQAAMPQVLIYCPGEREGLR